MDLQERVVRQSFSKFILQMYHLGYNFIVLNTRGTTRWTVIGRSNTYGIKVVFDVKTCGVKVFSETGERYKYDDLEELHKVLLYNAGVEQPYYTDTTETIINLLKVTEGLIPLSFKTKSLLSNLAVFDLYNYGRIKNILVQKRDCKSFIILDNQIERLQNFLEKVFPHRASFSHYARTNRRR